jgi:hypothetical protein
MRKYFAGAALLVALAIPATAIAASLHGPHLGTSCPDGFVGTYHFVNPQTDGAAQGTLNATIGGDAYSVLAYKVNQHTQHFLIEDAEGAVTFAESTLPGKLVISDFACSEKKD